MISLVIISSLKCYYCVIDHIPYAVYYISVTNYNWRLGPTGFLSLISFIPFPFGKIQFALYTSESVFILLCVCIFLAPYISDITQYLSLDNFTFISNKRKP